MASEPAIGGNRRDLRDRVDHAVGVDGADPTMSTVSSRMASAMAPGSARKVTGSTSIDHLDAEVVSSLVKRSVGRRRDDHAGIPYSTSGPSRAARTARRTDSVPTGWPIRPPNPALGGPKRPHRPDGSPSRAAREKPSGPAHWSQQTSRGPPARWRRPRRARSHRRRPACGLRARGRSRAWRARSASRICSTDLLALMHATPAVAPVPPFAFRATRPAPPDSVRTTAFEWAGDRTGTGVPERRPERTLLHVANR